MGAQSTPSATETRPASEKQNWSLGGILCFLGRYPWQVAGCLGLLLVTIGIDMTLPQILGNAITALETTQADAGQSILLFYAKLFTGLVMVRAGVGFILGPMRNRLVQNTLGDIRSTVYNALQRLAFAYHNRTNTGELISRATTDIWRLQDFLFACLLLSADIAVSLVVIIVLIFAIHPWLGWMTLGTMLPTAAIIAWYAHQLQPKWRHVHDLHGAMTTVVQENIAGVRVVKAFAREGMEIEKFRSRKQVFLDELLNTVNFWAARIPAAQFVFGLTTPLVLWAGGRLVINGTLPLGDLAKVIFYLMAIGHRMGMIGQFTNILQNASASAERVLEIIREPATIQSGRHHLPPGRGALAFEQVSFEYRPGQAALHDINCRIEPGQTVAVVGPTGSGKTTLAHLIPRFYDPSRGRVLMEGMDVRELRLPEVRRQVGLIFQETFLFSTTVAENIAYGCPQASRKDIDRCATIAQACEFIEQLPNKYDTVIGERGISLSGGQRQRIAIARAFLMNPRILIFDDATASVDAQTEHDIQKAIKQLCANRTTFIIAHRVSTVQHADLILVLDRGHIVERGTHATLVTQHGFYRQVFERELHR